MSFLLFAARTIQIKRELNAKNYELTLITDKFNEATKKVTEKQNAIADMKNAFRSQTSLFAQAGQSLATAALTQQAAAGQEVNLGQFQYATGIGAQAGERLAATANSIFDNIVGAQQKAELARLEAQVSSLETRKTGLEQETALLQEEYNAYKDQAKQGVKDAVPQFA